MSVYDNGRLVARPALVDGVARVALRPRRSGRHLIVVRYPGASWIAPSRDWTTIRVR
ncbi:MULTISPECIES: Ig-like domain repeat protein [unclassified Nocardioides]|uniref:Ig-like domain repeat protein n=1 Tax=unclassified Nocardioides TaxID=2615069 RepID=UPI000A9DD8B5|nr:MULTISPECIES: Ig-like domain repeat protein [unclassified Nocardioides]